MKEEKTAWMLLGILAFTFFIGMFFGFFIAKKHYDPAIDFADRISYSVNHSEIR